MSCQYQLHAGIEPFLVCCHPIIPEILFPFSKKLVKHFKVNLVAVVVDAFLVPCRQILGDLRSDYQITSQQGSPQEMPISFYPILGCFFRQTSSMSLRSLVVWLALQTLFADTTPISMIVRFINYYRDTFSAASFFGT